MNGLIYLHTSARLGTSRTRRSRYGAGGMGRSVRTLRLRRAVIGASGSTAASTTAGASVNVWLASVAARRAGSIRRFIRLSPVMASLALHTASPYAGAILVTA